MTAESTANQNLGTTKPQSNKMGIVGLALSILGLLTLGLFSIPGLIVSLIALRREPRNTAIAGTSIGLAGMVLSIAFLLGLLLPVLAKTQASARAVKEANNLAQIHKAMLAYSQDEATRSSMPGPGHIARLTKPGSDEIAHDAGVPHTDSWGGPYRLRPSKDDPDQVRISSDGPDGTPDTDDDLVHHGALDPSTTSASPTAEKTDRES